MTQINKLAKSSILLSTVILGACGSTTTSSSSNPGSSATTSPNVTSASTSATNTNSNLRWIVAASGIKKIESAGGSAIASTFFDTPGSFILGHGGGLDSWKSTFVDVVTQVNSIQSISSSSSQPYGALLYDPEHWSFTPVSEQLAVGTATAAAQALASQQNLKLIVAPALDLTKVLAPGVASSKAYINLNIAGLVASHAYAIDIQAQSLEANTAQYVSFVTQAAAQARAANPQIEVFAGLSTNPSGRQVTASELFQDVNQTRSQVAGYWMNIPSGGAKCPSCGAAQPAVAIKLLQLLSNAGIS